MVVVVKGEACRALGGTESDDVAVIDGQRAKVIELLSVDKRPNWRVVYNRKFPIFSQLFQCAMLAANPLEERVFEERGWDRHGAMVISSNGGHVSVLGRPGEKDRAKHGA